MVYFFVYFTYYQDVTMSLNLMIFFSSLNIFVHVEFLFYFSFDFPLSEIIHLLCAQVKNNESKQNL